MRRIALLGLIVLLPGCEYVASPFVGFGSFIGDTHSFERDPNRPVGNSENMLRVTGRPVNVPALLPEPGNVWPGPQPPEPTLQDIERQQNNEMQPGALSPNAPSAPTPAMPAPALPQRQPRPITRGSSSPPIPDQSVTPVTPAPGPSPAPPQQAAPQSRTYITPQGPVQANPGANGVTTYQAPGGGIGIVVPNGNGTSTLIGPDGSVQSVPNPR